MTDEHDYSIVFKELNRALTTDASNLEFERTLIQDDEIRQFMEIIDLFEEQQEPPIYTGT